jgi:hypothetical protein
VKAQFYLVLLNRLFSSAVIFSQAFCGRDPDAIERGALEEMEKEKQAEKGGESN